MRFLFTIIMLVTFSSMADTNKQATGEDLSLSALRIESCYKTFRQTADNSPYDFSLEAGKGFVNCQELTEGKVLVKKNKDISSFDIFTSIGQALKLDIEGFASEFNKLVE